MNTIKITFEQAIASLNDANPFQTMATFVFADDRPNGNNQVLPFTEFEQVARTAIGMPVKMRFTGFGVTEHKGSVPIGVIQSMEIKTISDDYHQLVATAALWNGEYPEEVAWLKARHLEGTAPGISYEINHEAQEVVGNVKYIKGAYTGAAAFVKTPAYGTRTSLLALASLEKDELKDGIIALAKQLTDDTKGGNRMDEKELEALKAENITLKSEASSKQATIEELTSKLGEYETIVKTKDEEIGSLRSAAILESRVRKYTDAGFALDKEEEKAAKKKAVLASFSDEQFDDYLSELSSLKATTKAPDMGAGAAASVPALQAMASLSGIPVPRVEAPVDTDITSLKQGLRTLARPNSIE